MGIQVRKIGEKMATTIAGQKSLKEPRAVSRAEAPMIKPAIESTKTTMMPWNKWFQRWVAQTFGDDRLQQLKKIFYFAPDDIYDLQPSPKQAVKIPISATDPTITHQYRYPSPGSQGPVRIPRLEIGEDPYDSAYYKRDTRRRHLYSELGNPELEKARVKFLANKYPEAAKEEMAALEKGPESSPGNKGVFATGPTDFDPTGLRASMSANWPALIKSLDENMPDHLPRPIWHGKEDEIIKWHKDRDLSVTWGSYYEDLKVPRSRRVAYW